MTITPESFLTYEEELRLSDDLVERTKVRDALRARGQEIPRDPERHAEWLLTAEGQAFERGNRAATVLVNAYIPLFHALAAKTLISRSTYGSTPAISHEELVSEGTIAALLSTWAFDARGQQRHDPEGRPGVRFGKYVRLRVLKDMKRAISSVATPFKGNLDTISSTLAFHAVRNDLEASLGRAPLDHEVTEKSGIDKTNTYDNLPLSSSLLDVEEYGNIGEEDPDFEVARRYLDSGLYAGALFTAFTSVLHDTYVLVFFDLIGINAQGIPLSIPEVAKKHGITRENVRYYDEVTKAFMRHPQGRVRLANILAKANEALSASA